MEKMSNRIWLLIAGVAVAVAIAVSAVIAINKAEPSSQAGGNTLTRPSITSLPAVMMKKISGKPGSLQVKEK